MRWLKVCVMVGLLLGGVLPAWTQTRVEDPVAARYGISFYGIELPKEGANLLLIIDASKSMKRKDAARTTPGRRWDTLLDEVRSMRDAMAEATRRGIPFTVSILFEGGETAEKGIGPLDMSKVEEGETLETLLTQKEFLSGGHFETTFGEQLWPFVAQHAITYIIYLGDDDIGTYADCVRQSVAAWYGGTAAPERVKKQQKLKARWRKAWANWRPKSRKTPTFTNRKQLPPPPKEIPFSCVAIGQASPLLKELTVMSNGQYIERKSKSKRKPKQ